LLVVFSVAAALAALAALASLLRGHRYSYKAPDDLPIELECEP
jgi:hypothetical protein